MVVSDIPKDHLQSQVVQEEFLFYCLTFEDKGTTILLNISNYY